MIDTAPDISSPNKPNAINTSRFGTIDIDQDKVITLVSPFLGFPDDNTFVLLPHSPSSPFFWLQSTSTPELAFVVIQPNLIKSDFAPPVPASVKKELQLVENQDPEFMVILTIPKGKPKEMTANLLGPVAFNAKKQLAKQIVLDPTKYDPCWQVLSHN